MARPLRIEFEGAIYHVTARGNEKRKIFFSRRDYEKFKEYLTDAVEKFDVIVHGYVLMTNHYHLIIETPRENLSKIMHHINSSYTTYINVKRKRSGHLFQGRFKSIIVDKGSYLLELSRYIHLNPVRVKMVERPEAYSYSSYISYTTNSKNDLVTTKTILGMISSKSSDACNRYRSFVESALDGEVESPFKNVYGGIILGSANFIKDVLGKIGEDQLEKDETANRRSLRAPLLPEEVVSSICEHYGLDPKDILSTEHNDVRKKCIYLLKKQTSAANREIGEMLGGMGAAAVAKAYQRFSADLSTDPRLKKELKGLQGRMSRVKG